MIPKKRVLFAYSEVGREGWVFRAKITGAY